MKVLVVDDEITCRKVFEYMLARRGHTVRVAPGLAAARTLLAKEHFDVVLLDLMLRGESGLDFIPELQAHPDLKVVGVSAYAPYCAERFEAVGIADYVFKPVTKEHLYNAVEGQA